jgi:hypothetical protein
MTIDGMEGDFYSVNAGGPASPGTYQVSGSYSGYDGMQDDGTYCNVSTAGGTGTAVVPQGSTTTTVQAPSAALQAGQVLSLTATLAPEIGLDVAATGNLTLSYGNTVLLTQAVSQTVNSDGNQITTMNAPTKGVTPGNYSLTVTYDGDSNYSSSSGSCTAVIEAAQQATTTAVTAAPNPIVPGDTITLNVSVTRNSFPAGQRLESWRPHVEEWVCFAVCPGQCSGWDVFHPGPLWRRHLQLAFHILRRHRNRRRKYSDDDNADRDAIHSGARADRRTRGERNSKSRQRKSHRHR